MLVILVPCNDLDLHQGSVEDNGIEYIGSGHVLIGRMGNDNTWWGRATGFFYDYPTSWQSSAVIGSAELL